MNKAIGKLVMTMESPVPQEGEIWWYYSLTASMDFSLPIHLEYGESNLGGEKGKKAALDTLSQYFGTELWTGKLISTSISKNLYPLGFDPDPKDFSLDEAGTYQVFADGQVVFQDS